MTGGKFQCGQPGCPKSFNTIEESREHRQEDHDPVVVTDGSGSRDPEHNITTTSIDWPIKVNGHRMAKTHEPSLNSQRVACAGCGASAAITSHDIGINPQLDDLVVLLAQRLPADCQPIAADGGHE